MTNLITTMKKEQEYLEHVKQQVEEDIRQGHKDKLRGKLRIQKKGNSVQYYHVGAEEASENKSELSEMSDTTNKSDTIIKPDTINKPGTTNKSATINKPDTINKPGTTNKSDSSEKLNQSSITKQSSISNQKNQTYIPKKNITLARNLAQRDYDNKLLQEIDSRKKIMNKFLKEYPQTGLENTYEELNEYRKKLIRPIIETDESYAKEWINAPYVRKIIGEDVPVIFTENGERVRSKSEKMIADKLKQLGISYRYEAPLRFGRNLVLHPDFTLLHVKERKEIYYEHFGMMDNPEYVENALKRIEIYEKNGIFPGDKLLFSWETSTVPVNMKVVEGMVKRFF